MYAILLPNPLGRKLLSVMSTSLMSTKALRSCPPGH